MATKEKKTYLCQYALSGSESESEEPKPETERSESDDGSSSDEETKRDKRSPSSPEAHRDEDLPKAYRNHKPPVDASSSQQHAKQSPSLHSASDHSSGSGMRSTKRRLEDHYKEDPESRRNREVDPSPPRNERRSPRRHSGHQPSRQWKRSPRDFRNARYSDRDGGNWKSRDRTEDGSSNWHGRDDRSGNGRSRMRDGGEEAKRYRDSNRQDRSGRNSDHQSSRGGRSRGDCRERDRQSQRQSGTSSASYYKPGSKLAEQMQKRKLLWQGAKEKTVAQSWETMLSACTDEKQAEKLKKMIGLRGDAQQSTSGEGQRSHEPDGSHNEAKRQEEISRQLQQQYEVARMSTHTHRGMGLGFTSQLHSLYAHPVMEQAPSADDKTTKPGV